MCTKRHTKSQIVQTQHLVNSSGHVPSRAGCSAPFQCEEVNAHSQSSRRDMLNFISLSPFHMFSLPKISLLDVKFHMLNFVNFHPFYVISVQLSLQKICLLDVKFLIFVCSPYQTSSILLINITGY